MTERPNRADIEERDEIVPPPAARSCADHSFELPSALYGAVAALFLGFLAVTAAGFAHPEMLVPMAINVAFLTAFFGVPAIMVRTSPAKGSRSIRWTELMRKGIDTATGPTSGREAVILVLILPLLIFLWGVVVIAIAAAA